ncbi:hypothetical protein [Streptomyces sp. NPDC005573]|uniref:hypothetical protein n=1 Tax=unclassified Streptomyces TaxID=2593676 RepID=UPI00339DF4E5
MADVSFGVFALLLWGGACAFFVRAAWLHWTDPERAPALDMSRFASDPAVVRGHERGVVAFAGWLAGMTLGGVALVAGADLVGSLLVVGSLPLLAAHATITWFNRPRFLVPPHRRGETGSVVAWWRRRRASGPEHG